MKDTLVASIDPENKASKRVVQKAGFREERRWTVGISGVEREQK